MHLTSASLWIARLAFAVGLLIPIVWSVALWDFLHGRGPSPGAGAQYVFILMPTMVVAIILLGISTALHLQVLVRQAQTRRPMNWIVMTASALGFVVLATYWLIAAFRAAAA